MSFCFYNIIIFPISKTGNHGFVLFPNLLIVLNFCQTFLSVFHFTICKFICSFSISKDPLVQVLLTSSSAWCGCLWDTNQWPSLLLPIYPFFLIWQFELLFKERINIAYPMPKKIQILDFLNFTSQVPVIKGIDLGDFKSVLPALRRRGLGMMAQRSEFPARLENRGDACEGCLVRWTWDSAASFHGKDNLADNQEMPCAWRSLNVAERKPDLQKAFGRDEEEEGWVWVDLLGEELRHLQG